MGDTRIWCPERASHCYTDVKYDIWLNPICLHFPMIRWRWEICFPPIYQPRAHPNLVWQEAMPTPTQHNTTPDNAVPHSATTPQSLPLYSFFPNFSLSGCVHKSYMPNAIWQTKSVHAIPHHNFQHAEKVDIIKLGRAYFNSNFICSELRQAMEWIITVPRSRTDGCSWSVCKGTSLL